MDEWAEKFWRALMACIKAERVRVSVDVVTPSGLEQALAQIVKLDERVQQQYHGLFAQQLCLGEMEYDLAMESYKLRQGVGVVELA